MLRRGKVDRQAERERRAVEAAGAYLLATIADDERRVDDAVAAMDVGVLQLGLLSIAQEAVSALAAERGSDVEQIVAALVAAAQNREVG